MSRSATVTKALVLLALILLCVPAGAQITINPGDILGKIFKIPKAKPSPNAPASPNAPINGIAPPANDNFANREHLVGTDVRAQADNRGATVEADEPEHRPGTKNERTVWWTWTAPDTGRVTLDTLGDVSGIGYTQLVVYVGNSLDSLLPITRGLNYTKNYQLTFPVEGGRSYQIVSAGGASNSGSYGQTGFNLHFTKTNLPPPIIGRDNFNDRAALKGNEAMAVANNEQTTLETDEPTHTPGAQNLHTVWWTWTAPATGKVTIDTLKLGVIPTALTFYQGAAMADLVPVVRTRGLNEGDKMVLPVAPGQTYQIVSNGGNGQVGFNLHFTPNALPPPVVGRDNFADRAALKGSEAMAVANNEQATIETDEPDHMPGQKDARTVWWTWTAPAKGQVAIDTLKNVSGTQATALAVYTGDALAGLVPVARKDAGTLDYALAFPVKAGTAYQIVVNGGDSSSVGQVGFNLHFHPAPPGAQEVRPIPKPKPKRKVSM